MRTPPKTASKLSSHPAKPSSSTSKKLCHNCRTGRAPCLSSGITNLCCNCLSPEWRTCVNGCDTITDSDNSDSSYELAQLSPSKYVHEVQIKKLEERNKALARWIDFLQERQETMFKQIRELKKEVAGKIKKT